MVSLINFKLSFIASDEQLRPISLATISLAQIISFSKKELDLRSPNWSHKYFTALIELREKWVKNSYRTSIIENKIYTFNKYSLVYTYIIKAEIYKNMTSLA